MTPRLVPSPPLETEPEAGAVPSATLTQRLLETCEANAQAADAWRLTAIEEARRRHALQVAFMYVLAWQGGARIGVPRPPERLHLRRRVRRVLDTPPWGEHGTRGSTPPPA